VQIEQPTRRKFLSLGLGLIAAPVIVRASSLMPVKAWMDNVIWIDADACLAPLPDFNGMEGWGGHALPYEVLRSELLKLTEVERGTWVQQFNEFEAVGPVQGWLHD
jgi:hypothetical protein